MKKLTGGVVAMALLLAGCGSSETPAAQTVTATATVTAEAAPTTVVSTQKTVKTERYKTTMEVTIPTTVFKTAVRTEFETVTETAQPPAAAPADPGDAGDQLDFENGDYLIGSKIAPGTYECLAPGDGTAWLLYDNEGTPVGGNYGAIAIVTDDAYTVKLTDCGAVWAKR